MDIYWIKEKKQHGPATVPDIISLVQMGELTPDTLGWHAGCTTWAPLRELPALADFLGELHATTKAANLPPAEPQAPLPPTAEAPAAPTQTQASAPQTEAAAADVSRITLPQPRTRLMARLIDSSLYAAIAAYIVYKLGISFTEMLQPLFWAPMVLLEAILLTWWGTTPGKRLMGITISSFSPGGAPMTFGRAFFRSLSVNVIGMGCFLFPVCLATMVIAHVMLTRRGITLWDAQCFTLPIQRKAIGLRHFILGGLIIYFAMQLTSQALIRTPGTMELLEQTSPDMAKTLREMMPDLPQSGAKNAPQPPATPQPLQ
ncbi:MAG: RDD family protein [Akkermansia sp.]|nr:RDD family protein [Akkermansia sp.]